MSACYRKAEMVRAIVNGCSPAPVGIVSGGEVGFDEAVTGLGDPVCFVDDVVVDGLVEVLVRFVGDGEFVLPAVGAVLFHVVAAEDAVLDLLADLLLAPDVFVVVGVPQSLEQKRT